MNKQRMAKIFFGIFWVSSLVKKGILPGPLGAPLLALAVFTVMACPQKQNEVSELPAARVVVQVMAKAIHPELIKATGSLAHIEKAAVTAKVEGRVKRLTKRLGDAVAAGELLAELESQSYELEVRKALVEVRQAQASVRLAEARHGEAKRRVENNIVAAARAADGVSRRQLSLDNRRRILSNQEVLLVQGGVPRDRVQTLQSEYRQEEYDLSSAQKELVMLNRGLRDEDFTEAGLPIPLDPRDRLVGLKDMGTRVEAAEVEQAQGALAAAELRLETARLYLAECLVRSPRSGVIAQRSLDPGEEATRQTPIYVILETGAIHAAVNLGEADYARVAHGQKARVWVGPGKGGDEGDEGISAKVDMVSPILDPSTRSAEVRLWFPSRAGWKPGMVANVEIDTGRVVEGWRLPAEAVERPEKKKDRESGDRPVKKSPDKISKAFVWVAEGAVCHRREVKVAAESGGFVDVVEGLKDGDKVVVEGMEGLREGQAVSE